MKCGCVFWEFAKKKLATRKDKIKIIKTKRDSYTTCLSLTLSVSQRFDGGFQQPNCSTNLLLAILNGTSNPIGLHNEHSLFQRISIHLHYDVKARMHLASLLTTD
jgi:hypothetical protein